MNKMWECDATIDADIIIEYTEIYTPTMQLAWEENELGKKELVQLHINNVGEKKWMPIQII